MGLKLTFVDPCGEQQQRARPGFIPVEMYASLKPEPGEIGSIASVIEEKHFDDCTVRRYGEPTERIFVRRSAV